MSKAKSQSDAKKAARSLIGNLSERFEKKRYRTTATITNVQRDSAQRVIGAVATIDGLAAQTVQIDHGAPVAIGDVYQVENQGSETATSWIAIRRLRSASAVPPIGQPATLPTPSGLVVNAKVVQGFDGPVAYLYAVCNSVDDSFGILNYVFELSINDLDVPNERYVTIDTMETGEIQAAIDASETVIPHNEIYGMLSRSGRIKLESELIDYDSYVWGVGDSGTGTGGTNTLTDATKTWTSGEWIGHALVDSVGTIFEITANSPVVLTVVGTPASGAYEIHPAFLDCTRAAGGSTAATHADNKTYIRRTIGANLGPHPADTDYNVRVRTERPADGSVSTWSAWVTKTTPYDTVAPYAATDLAAVDAVGGVILSWSGPDLNDTPDLAGFEVYQAINSSGLSAVLVKTIGQEKQVFVEGVGGLTRWYNVKPFDRTGNVGDYAASWVSATPIIGPGVLLLPYADLSVPPKIAYAMPYGYDDWQFGSYTLGAFSYDYQNGLGIDGGAGIQIDLDDDEALGIQGMHGSPWGDWEIPANTGQYYVASLHIKTTVSEGDFSFYDDVDGKLVFRVYPAFKTGTSTWAEPTATPVVWLAEYLLNGWIRLAGKIEVQSGDTNLVGWRAVILNRTGSSITVYADRPKLEQGGDVGPWSLCNVFSSSGTGIRFDVSGFRSYNDYLGFDEDGQITSILRPDSDNNRDLGTATVRFKTIYAVSVVADTVVGQLSGGEWEHSGDMVIDAHSDQANTVVSIVNQGSQQADLSVDRNILVGGTVDGVDIAGHAVDADAHHDLVSLGTSLASNLLGLTGQQLTLDSQAANYVFAAPNGAPGVPSFRALVSADFGSISHNDLTNVTADQHHNRQHSLVSTSDHSATGLTTGYVIRATGSTTFAWAQLQHSDLGGVSSDQHHSQVHSITGSDHSISASQYQLVGATGTDTLGLLTPSSSPGAAVAILRTDASGHVQLAGIGIGATPEAGNVALGNSGKISWSDAALVRGGADTISPGTGDSIRSATFTSGLIGWSITAAGDAEFSNVRIRGELSSAVFKYDEIHATAGTFGVWKSASTLYADCTTVASPTTFTLAAKNTDAGAALFESGDVLRLRSWTGSAILDNWVSISSVGTNYTTYTEYTCVLESGTPGTFRAGATVVDYGSSGDGFITLSADGGVGSSPNITLATHAGSPWSTFTNYMRVGNLNGSYGVATDQYGVGIGRYGSASQPSVVVTGGDITFYNQTTDVMQIDGSGPSIRVGQAAAARIVIDTTNGLQLFSSVEEVFRLPLSGAAQLKGSLTVQTGGYIQVGSGTKDSDLTGININAAEFVSQYSGTDQIVINTTTGKLTAGGEKVWLDADGLSMIAPEAAGRDSASGLKFFEVGSLHNVGGMYAWSSTEMKVEAFDAGIGEQRVLTLTAKAQEANSFVIITADSGTDSCQLWLQAGPSQAEFMALYDGYALFPDGGIYVGASSDPGAGNIRVTGGIATAGAIYIGSASASISGSNFLEIELPNPGVVLDMYGVGGGWSRRFAFNSGGTELGAFGGYGAFSGSDATLNYLWVGCGDYTTAGLRVYPTSNNVYTMADLYAKQDVRVEDGIFVGSTALDPSAGNIHYTGTLQSYKDSQNYAVYAYRPLTSPLTSTSWDNETISVGSGTIYLNSTHGLSYYARAAYVRISAKWTSASDNSMFVVRAYGTSEFPVFVRASVGGYILDRMGVVPVDSSGRISYQVYNAQAQNVTLEIHGYFI